MVVVVVVVVVVCVCVCVCEGERDKCHLLECDVILSGITLPSMTGNIRFHLQGRRISCVTVGLR